MTPDDPDDSTTQSRDSEEESETRQPPGSEASGDGDSSPAQFHRCDRCSRAWYYDRAVCAGCGHRSFSAIEPATGTVVARTSVHVTPDGVPSPLELGLAAFPDVGHVVAQFGGQALEHGDPVDLRGAERLRRDADGTPVVGPKLYPAARTTGATPSGDR